MQLVAVKNKYQVVIPHKLRQSIKIKVGDFMEAKLERGSVVLTPKKVVDYSDFPNADDEYTPRQRRILDRQLEKGLADVRAGRTAGPFDTADEMIAHMKGELKKRSNAKKLKLA